MVRAMKGDLISRSALIEALELAKTYQPMNPVALDLTISVMKAAPAVDAVEVVRHGRWELVTTKCVAAKYVRVGYCQNCNEERLVDNYCSNCGAKMDGDSHA